MSATKDIHTITSISLVNKKSNKENITPHRIAVVLFIKEFCNFKTARGNGVSGVQSLKTFEDGSPSVLFTMEPKHRRDFCMLVLKLIQCRDLELDEFFALLKSGKYELLGIQLTRFQINLTKLYHNGVGALQDLMQGLGNLLVEAGLPQMSPPVNKSSVVGLYLRRIMIFFDKLTFSQVISTYLAYQVYFKRWNSKIVVQPAKEVSTTQDLSQDDLDGNTSVIEDIEMDLCEDDDEDDVKLPLNDTPVKKTINVTTASLNSDLETRFWSRRQAELFLAQQSSLIQTNEVAAMSPPELQQKIRDLLQANPEYAEAHYLSYLNCLRSREFCGAVDSLFHCFDRNLLISDTKTTTPEEKSRGSRYAALNLAVLHTSFGHRREALAALKEAIMLAHEFNDNVCLQYALAWLYKLTEDNKEVLMERSISKSSDLNLSYLTSLGIQSFAQHAGITAGRPALVFDLLMKSDVLNCQHSMIELMANSHAQKAALWFMYGKTEMASLSSQLLLHLNTASLTQGVASYNVEGTCHALCNVANILLEQGEYDLAALTLSHARDRFPHEPVSRAWALSERLLAYTRALHRGEWQDAAHALAQMVPLDRWETQLRKAELCMAKADYPGASESIYAVLDYSRARAEEDTIAPAVRARAMILAAEVQCCASSPSRTPSSAVPLLTAALNLAQLHYLDYLAATVSLHLANLQLQMGLPLQALKLLERCLLVVLSHGGFYDQGRALLLIAKCKVAASASLPDEARQKVLLKATQTLAKVKWYFEKVEAYSRVKDVLYMMTLLYNELGNVAEKKKCSLEFRKLDEHYPTKIATTLLTRL